MGNVFASSLVETTVPGSVPPPNLPEQPSTGKYEPAKETSEISSDPNPGALEDIHKKCKDVFPTTFEGSKLMINKMLSSHFQVSHSINLSMSNTTPSGYRFGATYVGSNQVGPMEAYPILLGDIDPSGNLSAHIIHQYKNIRGKYVAQVQDSKFVASQLALDYKGLDYTASLMLANTDILNNSGVAVLHYLQNVIPSLALGAEMVCQYGPQVPGGHVSAMSLAGRYTGSNYTASATVNLASLHACFYRKGGENMQMGVELETNLRLGETLCSIGYQIDLPKANLMFRGMVDSNWNVGAVLEKKLTPLPFTLALSGMLNHTKCNYRCGIGLIIG